MGEIYVPENGNGRVHAARTRILPVVHVPTESKGIPIIVLKPQVQSD